MGEHYSELSGLLARVRNRWRAVAALRAWSLAAAVTSLVLALALVAQRLVVPDGFALVALWLVAAAVALVVIGWMAVPLRRAPADRQIARFIEECCPELEDALVTAIAERGARRAAPDGGRGGRRRGAADPWAGPRSHRQQAGAAPRDDARGRRDRGAAHPWRLLRRAGGARRARVCALSLPEVPRRRRHAWRREAARRPVAEDRREAERWRVGPRARASDGRGRRPARNAHGARCGRICHRVRRRGRRIPLLDCRRRDDHARLHGDRHSSSARRADRPALRIPEGVRHGAAPGGGRRRHLRTGQARASGWRSTQTSRSPTVR